MTRDLEIVLGAIDSLVGKEVEVAIELELAGRGSGERTFRGVASWYGDTPNCAPAFLSVGDSGLPVGGHGCCDARVLPGGVTWRDFIARYSVVAVTGASDDR